MMAVSKVFEEAEKAIGRKLTVEEKKQLRHGELYIALPKKLDYVCLGEVHKSKKCGKCRSIMEAYEHGCFARQSEPVCKYA